MPAGLLGGSVGSQTPLTVQERTTLDRALYATYARAGISADRATHGRPAPLLRDLHLASRACFEELAEESGNDFGLVKRGLLMVCKTPHALDEEAQDRALLAVERRLDTVAEDLADVAPDATGVVGGESLIVEAITDQVEEDLATGETVGEALRRIRLARRLVSRGRARRHGNRS